MASTRLGNGISKTAHPEGRGPTTVGFNSSMI